MRTQKPDPGTRWRMLLASSLVALLAGCTSTPAPQPLRTYGHIQGEQVYFLTRTVLMNAGYQAERCHAGRICIETAWREYDGEKRGAAAGRERRKYTARYEVDPIYDQYTLFLDLAVQEQAPGASAWIDKSVDRANDPEYLRILQAMDQAVRKGGGVQI